MRNCLLFKLLFAVITIEVTEYLLRIGRTVNCENDVLNRKERGKRGPPVAVPIFEVVNNTKKESEELGPKYDALPEEGSGDGLPTVDPGKQQSIRTRPPFIGRGTKSTQKPCSDPALCRGALIKSVLAADLTTPADLSTQRSTFSNLTPDEDNKNIPSGHNRTIGLHALGHEGDIYRMIVISDPGDYDIPANLGKNDSENNAMWIGALTVTVFVILFVAVIALDVVTWGKDMSSHKKDLDTEYLNYLLATSPQRSRTNTRSRSVKSYKSDGMSTTGKEKSEKPAKMVTIMDESVSIDLSQEQFRTLKRDDTKETIC